MPTNTIAGTYDTTIISTGSTLAHTERRIPSARCMLCQVRVRSAATFPRRSPV
jgi:hypothetical protein